MVIKDFLENQDTIIITKQKTLSQYTRRAALIYS